MTVYDYEAVKSKLELKQGAMLFLNDNEQFKKGQVIAEMGARGNTITERVTKDLSTELSGQVYFSDLFTEEKVDRQGNTTVTTSKGGLIWILEGDVYNIPSSSEILIKEDDKVTKNDVLAFTQVVSDYGGTVRLNEFDPLDSKELQIVTASVSLKNGVIRSLKDSGSSDAPFCLELTTGNRFLMHCSPGNKISHSQIIAEFIDSSYSTYTGGIIKYQNLQLDESNEFTEDYQSTSVSSGTILWVPEETHEVNKDISLLHVKQGEYLRPGQEILKDLYTTVEGYVNVVQENGIVREVVIKPGYFLDGDTLSVEAFITPKIVESGEEILPGKIATEKVFVEVLFSNGQMGLLVRPVKIYQISNNPTNFLDQEYLNESNHFINLKLVNTLPFKDGERVKSVTGIDLLKTYIILETESNVPHLSADIEFVALENSQFCKLQLVVLETLSIKQDTFGDSNKGLTVTTLCVNNNEKIVSGTIVAQTKLLCRSDGQVKTVSTTNNASKKILISTSSHEKTVELNGLTPQVAKGDLVRYGDQIADNIIASNSGQIVYLDNNKIVIRSGCPYLISSGAILQVSNLDLVQRGDILAILVFERSKTGDIVQGLPRIEEILEGRKPKEPCKLSQSPGIVKVNYNSEEYNAIKIIESETNITDYLISPMQKIIVSNGESIGLAAPITDGAPNPHEMLSIFFNFYKSIVHLYDAAKFSLQKVQLYLVNEVQSVYQSQNVDISDKHIEVIVRQMTSKVRVEDGGDTTLLPGELVELQQIDNINEAMTLTKGIPATYSPMLLGITKSSLNTDSFISAASFQETTRVLTEAAIEGKADWLRGLKENVIIGRLIPAGTGFNAYLDSSKSLNAEKQTEVPYSYYLNNRYPEESKGLEDFILDDNIARNYGRSDL